MDNYEKVDMPTKLTPEIITAAILGFEEQKRHINTKIAQLRAMLSGGPVEPASSLEAPKRKRRKMSAAARARIAEAQRRRWAGRGLHPRQRLRSPNEGFRRPAEGRSSPPRRNVGP